MAAPGILVELLRERRANLALKAQLGQMIGKNVGGSLPKIAQTPEEQQAEMQQKALEQDAALKKDAMDLEREKAGIAAQDAATARLFKQQQEETKNAYDIATKLAQAGVDVQDPRIPESQRKALNAVAEIARRKQQAQETEDSSVQQYRASQTEENRARAKALEADAASTENELRAEQGGGSVLERFLRKVPLVGGAVGDVAYGRLPAPKAAAGTEVTPTTIYTRESIERVSEAERKARSDEAREKYRQALEKMALDIRKQVAAGERYYSNDPNRDGEKARGLSIYELKFLAEKISDRNAVMELAARAPFVNEAFKALIELAEGGNESAIAAVQAVVQQREQRSGR